MTLPWRLVLSALLGLGLPWIPGFWIPGMLLAAIPFPEGMHSGHADLYFVFAMAIDFFLYAGVAYWLLNIFFPRNVKAEQMLS
jgi:hypothetical protein